MERLDFPKRFVACDLKTGHTVFSVHKNHVGIQGLPFPLVNMALAKGHLSKTKSQVSEIGTICSLVLIGTKHIYLNSRLVSTIIS